MKQEQKSIKQVRWDKNMTVEEVAKKAQISQSELTKIENKQVSPTIDFLCKISNALGVDVCTICGCKGGSYYNE